MLMSNGVGLYFSSSHNCNINEVYEQCEREDSFEKLGKFEELHCASNNLKQKFSECCKDTFECNIYKNEYEDFKEDEVIYVVLEDWNQQSLEKIQILHKYKDMFVQETLRKMRTC
jgi:hypothetical protein